jgi:hypothetical protein
MRLVHRIAVPALIITADDDPFVPSHPFRDPKITSNPYIELLVCRHGGHCGFIGRNSEEPQTEDAAAEGATAGGQEPGRERDARDPPGREDAGRPGNDHDPETPGPGDDDGYWAELEIIRFMQRQATKLTAAAPITLAASGDV